MSSSLSLTAIIERKYAQMPRFVIVPGAVLTSWEIDKTTVVDCKVDGVDIGRRTLKRWDDERWFIDLPASQCQRAGVDTGDSVTLTLQMASTRLPKELSQLIRTDPAPMTCWERLTESQQRMLREHIAEAKQSATRKRRAVRALNPAKLNQA